MDFILKFTLISSAAIFFFVVGLRLAINHFDLHLLKLLLIFVAIAAPLSFVFLQEPIQNRVLIAAVWTSVIGIGFRFGRKMIQSPTEDSNAEAGHNA